MHKGDIVKILKVGNGQCHNNPGDGEVYLLGKQAKVIKVAKDGKVYVTPLDYDYVLWFAKDDLAIVPKDV